MTKYTKRSYILVPPMVVTLLIGSGLTQRNDGQILPKSVSQPSFTEIASQKPLSLNNCMECILNSLRYSSHNSSLLKSIKGATDAERDKQLMDEYGGKPSTDYPTGSRFRSDGISSPDLRAIYNDFREVHKLSPLAGGYLELHKDETAKQLAERVHRYLLNSLKQGEPPIIQIRSQAARLNAKTSQYFWQGLDGYAITVVEVPESINPDGSFTVKYIDSVTGAKNELMIFNDPRNFGANKNAGGEKVWLNNRPFLAVCGPSLFLSTTKEDWHMRTLMYLYYGIYKE
jgi:hypothetical protein